MKKFVVCMLGAVMALSAVSLTACGGDNSLQKDAGITLDGKMTEEAYDAIPSRTAGIKGQLKAQFAADQKGLYVGISVSDADMRYTSDFETMVQGDYVGLAIDVAAKRGAESSVSEKTALIRFDCKGRYSFSRGNDYGVWEEISTGEGTTLDNGEMPAFAYYIDGAALETDNASEPIGNKGYNAELFFSWELLGTTAKEINTQKTVMYCIEHRDYGVDVCTDAVITAPSYYNSLTLLGSRKGSNMPENAPEITIDGKMDEAVWESATVTNSGNFAQLFEGETAGDYVAKAFMGKDGLYLGVQVNDPQLEAKEGTGSAYKNCGMEMRIHVFDANGVPVLSYKWLFDLFGPQWHETVGGGINSSFAPYAEYCYDIRGTINDNSDTDEGWGFEMYIPYEHLGITNAQGAYIQLLHAVGSAEQHNALPAEYEEKNKDDDGDVDWDNVSDYIRISK